MSTPSARGFAMPPEWAPHERCWMAWPSRSELWGDRLGAARKTCAELARAIAEFEPVTMIARPDLTAEASLQCGRGIPVVTLDHSEAWTRDIAPTFVLDGQGTLAGIDWRFKGYGRPTPGHEADAAAARAICERLQIERIEAPVVLEGGALYVDGEGTCLAAAASILDPARNPGVGRSEIEGVLRDYLGLAKVIWLERGLEGDRAGGHVANLVRFAAPGKLLVHTCRDPEDPNHEVLRDSLERLKAETDAQGRELETVEIELPAPRQHADGHRLPASYLDFYLANGAVIMPMFDDAGDRAAYRAVSAAFPDREIVEIEVSDLVYGGGGIHSITMQQPASPEG